MKKLFLLPNILTISLGMAASSPEHDGPGSLSWKQIMNITQQAKTEKRQDDIRLLRQAKKYMISGNVEMALYLLKKIDSKSSNLSAIKQRYLTLTYFMNEEFEKAMLLLDQKFTSEDNYRMYCHLKIITRIMLSKYFELDKDLKYCSNLVFRYSKNLELWNSFVVDYKASSINRLRDDPEILINKIFDKIELIKIFLKFGLFTGQEERLEAFIPHLPGVAYHSKKIREMIGMMYYRLGKDENALNFIEDINSVNSENIKGNMELKANRFETAYAYYNSALKKKPESTNALERAIPLAWMLRKWDEGLNLSYSLLDEKLLKMDRLAIQSAFLIKQQNYEKAWKVLKRLHPSHKSDAPLTTVLLGSYLSTMLSANEEMFYYVDNSCKKLDGLNCWLKFGRLIWEDLGKTIQRDEKIKKEHDLTVDQLKSEVQIDPFNEDIYNEQKVIEELDNLY